MDISLSSDDLNEIRSIIESALTRQSDKIIKPIQNKLQALRNGSKEIYDMLSGLQGRIIPDAQFQTLTLDEKLLKLNSELLVATKQAGVSAKLD